MSFTLDCQVILASKYLLVYNNTGSLRRKDGQLKLWPTYKKIVYSWLLMFDITQKSKNMNCGGIKICHLTFPRERQHRSSATLSAFRVLGGAAVRTRRPRGPGADHTVCRAGHFTGHLCRGRLAFTVVDGYILSYRRQRWAHLRFDILTQSCRSNNSAREWVKHKLGNVLFLRGTRGWMKSGRKWRHHSTSGLMG